MGRSLYNNPRSPLPVSSATARTIASSVFDERMRKSEIGERLLQTLEDIDISTADFAAKVGLAKDSLKNYSQGKAEPKDNLYQVLRDEYGINPEWVRYGTGSRFADNEKGSVLKERHNEAVRYASQNISSVEKIKNSAQPLQSESSNVGSPINTFESKGAIRVFLTPANAGRGFALEDMPDAEDRRPLFTNNSDILVVPVSGNSMEPVIFDGDKVYVDTSRREPRSGEIVLCNVDGVNYVKYYIKADDGRIYLASENEGFEPFRINGFNNSSIYGVVIQISRTPERAGAKVVKFLEKIK